MEITLIINVIVKADCIYQASEHGTTKICNSNTALPKQLK